MNLAIQFLCLEMFCGWILGREAGETISTQHLMAASRTWMARRLKAMQIKEARLVKCQREV